MTIGEDDQPLAAIERGKKYIEAFQEAKATLEPDAGSLALARAVIERMEAHGLVPAGTLSDLQLAIAQHGREIASPVQD